MQWKQKISGVIAAAMLVGNLPAAFAWEAPEVSVWQEASRDGVKARKGMQWKQKISGVIAAAMLVGNLPAAFAWEAPEVSVWQEASRDGVKARFFVGSDTHFGRKDAETKVANALAAFHQVDPNATGVLVVGDLTDGGKEEQYDLMMNTINASALGEAGKVQLSFHQVDPNATGVLVVGDLTDGGKEEQYDLMMNTINASALGEAGKVQLSMGNHDHYSGGTSRFENKTGQKASQVLYYDESGKATDVPGDTLAATVVKLNPRNSSGSGYSEDYDMLKTALETASAKNNAAPVIVMGHHGIKNTAYVTNEWYGNYGEGTDKDMVALLKKYPQSIHISGHSHSTLEDARSIYQDDGFTAIQDSTIGAYFENEKGKVDPNSGNASTYPEDSDYSSQALRIDVLDDNTVKVYRMDLTEGAYMYEDEPWTFSSSSLPYTSDRADSSKAPSFDEGAEVTVEDVSGTSMVVKFPAAKEASEKNADMIHEYQITLTDEEGAETVRKVFADYYKADRKENWAVKIKDLKAETTYSVKVKAVTSFDKASNEIVAAEDVTTGEGYKPVYPAQAILDVDFSQTYSVKVKAVTSFDKASNEIVAAEDVTTGEGYKPVYPAQAILDVDFSQNKTGEDAKGHKMTVYGEPQFSKDQTIGRTVASFDGEDDGLRYDMSTSDYEKLTQNFTIELYYMPRDTKNNNPMGNTQSSGFCFEQAGGTNTLQFWSHIGGDYKKPAAQVEKDAWNHVVGTYDGQNVKMYINGELKDTVAATGSLKEPPHYLFLGGDTSSDGELEFQANCKIALARVYTGTMTAEDVQKAYAAASAKPETSSVEVEVLGEDHVQLEDGTVPFRFAMQNMERVAAATLNFTVQDKTLVKDGKITGLNGFKALDGVKWTEEGDTLQNMERVAAATLNFTVQDKTLVKDGKITGLNGFKALDGVKWTEEGDTLKGSLTLSYLTEGGLTKEDLLDIARLTFTAAGKTGTAAVELKSVEVAGYDENGEPVFLTSDITAGKAQTLISSKYDLNGDSKVDLLDIAYAQKYYQRNTASADWAQAERCDVTGDGMVDLEDLISILHAYAA